MLWHYRKIAVTLLLFCFAHNAVNVGDLLFVKERIAVTILSPDTVVVNGDYYFGSSDSKATTRQVFYPFPIDSVSKYPPFIAVNNLKTGSPQDFNKSDQGISFAVFISNYDTALIRVIYKQQVKHQHGRYILR